MDQSQDRALIRERHPGFFALWGLGLSVLVAAVWGFVFDASRGDDRAPIAALEAVVIFGWLGAPLGGFVGFIVELTRPVRQRRMLDRRSA